METSMTIKLYDQDPHCRTFTATVLSCVRCDAGYRIVLNQTAFFPGGGGQACDRGRLGGADVLSVTEDEGIIYHIVSRPLPTGRTVTGFLDWDFRFDNMQQHSGEHILSGVIHQMKGYDNVGFHMNDTVTTVDFNGPLTEAEIEEAERRANQIIYRNIPIRILYPSPDELSHMHYRSKKELTGSVRIVQVGDYDLCACCAPHVALTGEIGQIQLIDAEHYKGGVRFTLLCGARAVAYQRKQNDLLHRLGARLCVPVHKVEEALGKQEEEKEATKASLIRLSEELIQARLAAVSPTATACCLLEPALDANNARRLVNALTRTHDGLMAVLLPSADSQPTRYSYIIGSRTQDLRPFSAQWNEAFQGRGGGSSQMIQGTVYGDPADMKRFLDDYSSDR
jgi:alanyl-tRNA synthetase